MTMTLRQTAGQNYYIKIVKKSFENTAKFKYLRTIVANKNTGRNYG
jgi:hypothetical protein